MLSRNKTLLYVSDDVPMFAHLSQETVGRAETKMLMSFWEKKTLNVSVLTGSGAGMKLNF